MVIISALPLKEKFAIKWETQILILLEAEFIQQYMGISLDTAIHYPPSCGML